MMYDGEFIEKYKDLNKNILPMQSFVLFVASNNYFDIRTTNDLSKFIFMLYRDLKNSGSSIYSIKSILKKIWKLNLKERFTWDLVEKMYKEVRDLDIKEGVFEQDEYGLEILFESLNMPTDEIKQINILKEETNNFDKITYEFILKNDKTFTLNKDEIFQPIKFINSWIAINHNNPFLYAKSEYRREFMELYSKYIKWLLDTKAREVEAEYSDRIKIIDIILNILKRVVYVRKEEATNISYLYDDEKIYIPKNLLMDTLERKRVSISARVLFNYMKTEFNSFNNNDRVQINGVRKRFWTIDINEVFKDKDEMKVEGKDSSIAEDIISEEGEVAQ